MDKEEFVEAKSNVKYQKPLVYNRYLPYSELIEKEANEFLEEIKKNLSIALQKRELKRGYVYWSNQLLW